ncbi:glycosyltransferase family 2 protein [Verrucomicrobiales bacterium]|jgi:GT2 family glycosyltransferase|nr:glycosyltransferase family 2 protein [Verrucomicrobiales bacterium]
MPGLLPGTHATKSPKEQLISTIRTGDHFDLSTGFRSNTNNLDTRIHQRPNRSSFMKANVSIIVLSLMRLAQTRRTINSIFTHTSSEFELIIVDMGSKGDALTYLSLLSQQKQNVHVVYNTNNTGTSAGRNQGLALATKEWVVFLDNDTEVSEGWIEALLARSVNPKVGACAPRLLSKSGRILIAPCSLVAEKSKGRLTRVGFRFEQSLLADDLLASEPQTIPWYPTTCLMARRTILEEIDGFDESLFMAEEDKDLCLRISEAGFDILYVPESSVVHLQLEKDPKYRAIRDNLAVIQKDIDTFEAKWQCKVVMECRRSYLKDLGMSDRAINLKKRFDIFSTVIEDE